MKTCRKCGIIKEKEKFPQNRKVCKICYSQRNKEYYSNNSERIKNDKKEYKKSYKLTEEQKINRLEYIKRYRIENPLKTKEYYEKNKDVIKEKVKTYRKNNSSKIRKYYNDKYNNDEMFHLKSSIRNLIRVSIKNKFTKRSKTNEILGCSFIEFKIFIELKFDNEMTWENHGIYWHLDHIIPVSWAETEEEIFKLNHFTNFQPLKISENLSKGNRFSGNYGNVIEYKK